MDVQANITARRVECKKSEDPQRDACYAWERDLALPDDPPAAIPVRNPFTTADWADEFRAFHEQTWRWGFERFGGGHILVTASPPYLRYSYRLRSAAAHAGLRCDPKGKLRPIITFGQRGPTRKLLLHEQAHLLTFTGRGFRANGDGHGPRFCAIALALYEQFFAVSRTAALVIACAHGLAVAEAVVET